MFNLPASSSESRPFHYTLDLNCFVYGDDPSRIFPVKIASTESVGTLKEWVKDKKKHAFEHVDAEALNVWKVRPLYWR